MKQTINLYLLLTALLFGWVGCSNEEEYLNLPPEGGGGASSLTFTFQGMKKGAVTYSVPGSGGETRVDSLEIYMFNDGSKLLERVFRVEKDSLGQQGADLKATIDVTGRTGGHIFYFVANGPGNASSLGNVDAGSTTEADFQSRLADLKTGLIDTPLLMTARSVIADIESPTDDEKKVSLKRRVARFDVDNDATQSLFTIHNIMVSNVKQQGYAFEDAPASGQEMPRGNLPVIAYGTMDDANTATPIPSLFYLYPTDIGENETVISVEGEFMNERRIYSLKATMSVDANKRYILKVIRIDPITPELEITVDNWTDDTGNHETEPGEGMEFGDIVLTDGDGTQVSGKSYDITDATKAGILTIPVTTYTESGTRMEVTYLHGTGNGDTKITFNNPDPVLTYTAGYYQKYRIDIPLPGKTPMHAQVEIINNSRPEIRDTIHINSIPNYDTTNEKPVLFGDFYWAPVNVGATEIGTGTGVEHMGLFFQWGRNKGFAYGSTGDTQAGPVTYEQATGEYKDKFITIFFGDWLSQNDNLWKGDNRQGPCPKGWRVPIEAELEIIKTAYGDGYVANGGAVIWDPTGKRLEIKGDNPEKTLYFPATGYRLADGRWTKQGTNGYFWSSNIYDIIAARLNFYGLGLNVNNASSAYGLSVRCVQD